MRNTVIYRFQFSFEMFSSKGVEMKIFFIIYQSYMETTGGNLYNYKLHENIFNPQKKRDVDVKEEQISQATMMLVLLLHRMMSLKRIWKGRNWILKPLGSLTLRRNLNHFNSRGATLDQLFQDFFSLLSFTLESLIKIHSTSFYAALHVFIVKLMSDKKSFPSKAISIM